jgi:phage FluMu protein gp41
MSPSRIKSQNMLGSNEGQHIVAPPARMGENILRMMPPLMLLTYNLIAGTIATIESVELSETDTCLNMMPLNHVYVNMLGSNEGQHIVAPPARMGENILRMMPPLMLLVALCMSPSRIKYRKATNSISGGIMRSIFSPILAGGASARPRQESFDASWVWRSTKLVWCEGLVQHPRTCWIKYRKATNSISGGIMRSIFSPILAGGATICCPSTVLGLGKNHLMHRGCGVVPSWFGVRGLYSIPEHT